MESILESIPAADTDTDTDSDSDSHTEYFVVSVPQVFWPTLVSMVSYLLPRREDSSSRFTQLRTTTPNRNLDAPGAERGNIADKCLNYHRSTEDFYFDLYL